MKEYTLINSNGISYKSLERVALGGNKVLHIYGRLDCPNALRWNAKGKYVKNRVFFKDEQTAIQAGYCPCALCMPIEYRKWKEKVIQ